MASYNQENHTILIAGDYNLDLLKYKSSGLIKHFLDNMTSSNFLPCINKATRISGTCRTLIDNIFVNDFQLQNISDIVTTDISDHFPIFLIMKASSTVSKKQGQTKRLFNNKTINTFVEKIHAVKWDDIYETESVQLAYSIFHEQIYNISESSFPKKNLKLIIKKGYHGSHKN